MVAMEVNISPLQQRSWYNAMCWETTQISVNTKLAHWSVNLHIHWSLNFFFLQLIQIPEMKPNQMSFNYEMRKNNTELTKHIWWLKSKQRHYTTKWKISKPAYSNLTERCNLCTTEKHFVVTKLELATLSKRNELVSTYRHRRKFILVIRQLGTWKWIMIICQTRHHGSNTVSKKEEVCGVLPASPNEWIFKQTLTGNLVCVSIYSWIIASTIIYYIYPIHCDIGFPPCQAGVNIFVGIIRCRRLSPLNSTFKEQSVLLVVKLWRPNKCPSQYCGIPFLGGLTVVNKPMLSTNLYEKSSNSSSSYVDIISFWGVLSGFLQKAV